MSFTKQKKPILQQVGGDPFSSVNLLFDDTTIYINGISIFSTALTPPTVNATSSNNAYQINSLNALSFPTADSGSSGSSIAIGPNAMKGLPSSAAYSNVAIGFDAIGGFSGSSLTIAAINNVAVGFQAMRSLTSGSGMVAVGYNALVAVTSGVNNVAVGWDALASVTTGNWNVAMGHDALANANGASHDNTAIGEGTLFLNGVAGQINHNTAIGSAALLKVTNDFNTAVGSQALTNAGNTQSNTAIGQGAGNVLTTGGSNTYVGCAVGSTTLTTGSNNILIGTSSAVDAPASGTSNFLNIGNAIYATGLGGTVRVGITNSSPNAFAALDITSTLGALLIPRMTTTQKNAMTAVNGMLVYDITLNKFQGYENGAWASLI